MESQDDVCRVREERRGERERRRKLERLDMEK